MWQVENTLDIIINLRWNEKKQNWGWNYTGYYVKKEINHVDFFSISFLSYSLLIFITL